MNADSANKALWEQVRDIKLPGFWGGERNRPLDSAIKIAKAADNGPEVFVLAKDYLASKPGNKELKKVLNTIFPGYEAGR